MWCGKKQECVSLLCEFQLTMWLPISNMWNRQTFEKCFHIGVFLLLYLEPYTAMWVMLRQAAGRWEVTWRTEAHWLIVANLQNMKEATLDQNSHQLTVQLTTGAWKTSSEIGQTQLDQKQLCSWLLKAAEFWGGFFHSNRQLIPIHKMNYICQLLSSVWLFATPWTVATRLLCPWNSPGKNTGVGSYSFYQRIFWSQGLNLVLPQCRQIRYHLSHQGSPSDEISGSNWK